MLVGYFKLYLWDCDGMIWCIIRCSAQYYIMYTYMYNIRGCIVFEVVLYVNIHIYIYIWWFAMVYHPQLCFMMLYDALRCFMMLDDALWCVMTMLSDNALWCFMVGYAYVCEDARWPAMVYSIVFPTSAGNGDYVFEQMSKLQGHVWRRQIQYDN